MAVVVLDASVLIAFFDASDAHHSAAVAALRSHEHESLVLPASAYAELLVGPLRRRPSTAAVIDDFLEALVARIEPLVAGIARAAAVLRARHTAFRLPDAFVLATAEVLDATVVLTADRAWAKVSRRVRAI